MFECIYKVYMFYSVLYAYTGSIISSVISGHKKGSYRASKP